MGKEKLVNIQDYLNEFIKIEDNDLYEQLPSQLSEDNKYIEGILANGVLLKRVK
jgi:hemerythrin-like domain-containing protein